ncbi:MAG: hypothetical protein ACK41C_10470 [Phenylobacterium sp.]|uniref:hypothetical protein n=1 Tax=Phenylobacterium sp. TaxID=1871053 RepID=UPI00391BD6CA
MAVKFNFQSLDQAVEADWPVSVNVPTDGGKVEVQTFTARFKLLQQAEIEAAIAEAKDAYELARRFFVGFGKGEETTLTEDLFVKMMGTPYVREAIQAAYRNFTHGVAVKN